MIRKDKSTKENREFWEYVERIAKDVDENFPSWKKGGANMNDNENKTNAPTINLLPCPFCGGEAKPERQHGDIGSTWAVICVGNKKCPCYCHRPYADVDKATAIQMWNTRNEADALRAEVGNALENAFDVHQKMVTTYSPTGQQVHACEMCNALNDVAAAIKPNAAGGEGERNEL